MPRLRIFYIVSLVLLGALIAFTVFKPMATGGEYSEVQREQLLRAEDQWIIQFDIMNYEGRDINYTIEVSIDDKLYKHPVLIPDGRMFTYIHHIYPDSIIGGDVGFAVYKEGDDIPLEEMTYHLGQ